VNRPAVIKLATTALHAGMRGDWPAATRATQAINDRHGGDGLLAAMLAWTDTFIHHRIGAFVSDKPVALAFQSVETGEIESADEVRPEIRWAGQMITARATDDKATWDALLGAVPQDPKVIGAHVGALLETIVLGLRGTQS
jgi:hypothetical protein